MHVDVRTETIIHCPVDEVAGYATDPANTPEWYANIRAVQWETPPPARRGTRVAFVATFLGRRLAYTYEIVDLVPGRRLVMRTAHGPFPMETTYSWKPVDDGRSTHMTLRNRGTPTGFSRLVSPFLAAAMRRANRKDLDRLRTILEAARCASTGSRRRPPRRADRAFPRRELTADRHAACEALDCCFDLGLCIPRHDLRHLASTR